MNRETEALKRIIESLNPYTPRTHQELAAIEVARKVLLDALTPAVEFTEHVKLAPDGSFLSGSMTPSERPKP